jgi:hypothetical protein
LLKIHRRKPVNKNLLGEIPAKSHSRKRTELRLKGHNGHGNCAAREDRKLDKVDKPSDAEYGGAGLERPSEATSTAPE